MNNCRLGASGLRGPEQRGRINWKRRSHERTPIDRKIKRPRASYQRVGRSTVNHIMHDHGRSAAGVRELVKIRFAESVVLNGDQTRGRRGLSVPDSTVVFPSRDMQPPIEQKTTGMTADRVVRFEEPEPRRCPPVTSRYTRGIPSALNVQCVEPQIGVGSVSPRATTGVYSGLGEGGAEVVKSS